MVTIRLPLHLFLGSLLLVSAAARAQEGAPEVAPASGPIDIRPQSVQKPEKKHAAKVKLPAAPVISFEDGLDAAALQLKPPAPAKPLPSKRAQAKPKSPAPKTGEPQLLDQGRMVLEGAAKPVAKKTGKGAVPVPTVVVAKPPEPAKPAEPAPAVAPDYVAAIPDSPRPAPEKSDDATQVAKTYCSALADDVAQARTAYQMKRIAELEEQLRTRISEFEAKRAELQKAIDRQDELRKKAEDGVIAIFSRMRPESAASQLSIMDDASAAALLGRLNPRTASSILNEIAPAKAARIADAMTGAAAPPRN